MSLPACWARWGCAAKRASCCTGTTVWREAVLRGKVSLVLLAADASPRTAQHMMDTCQGAVACEVMPLTGEELATLTPRPAAVFAVTEANLARLCANYLGSA